MNAVNNLKSLGGPPQTKKSSGGGFSLKFDSKVCILVECYAFFFPCPVNSLSDIPSFANRKIKERERTEVGKKQHGS